MPPSRPAASAVVLAAGEGRRMRSPLPKVLHDLGGRPLVAHVLDVLAALEPSPRPVAVVIGRDAARVREVAAAGAPASLDLVFAVQLERLGTAHAVLQAADAVAGRAGAVLVLYGDVPLLRPRTLESLRRARDDAGAAIALLTTVVDDPSAYGRVLRSPDGRVARIVEHGDASPAERRVREVNAGVYAFDDAWLWPALAGLAPSPSGELYLTDLVARAVADGRTVVARAAPDPAEVAGVNTPDELAAAAATLAARRAGAP